MLQRLEYADSVRREVAPLTTQKHKAQFGQFMTPLSVARFMASLFPSSTLQTCKLLDAGAGLGALSCAFLDRWAAGDFGFADVEACAYEIDPALRTHLAQTLLAYGERSPVRLKILTDDFIEHGAMLCKQGQRGFTHIILNPPYKKINSHSPHRLTLRTVGIETVNLYSAFVALAVELAAPGGQIVAIIPRSFCNGPYYRPFRDFVMERAAIRHIHLFNSRSKAFKDDGVLQENIIIRLERGGAAGNVTVSTSIDDSFTDLATHEHPFERIVFPGDAERFIHVPTSPEQNAYELSPAICHSLADLGIKVSTGPVVDFRLKEHICEMPEVGTVPLLYPGHFSSGGTEWPKAGMKKPNAILRNAETEKWLYPNGTYCVVRRFSSKEERRRIVASVVDPDVFEGAEKLGFENHLNVFHDSKKGLPEALAYGLAAYLNTSAVDENFRRFNGHTQVNATDLKQMLYPSRDALVELGKWAMQWGELTQAMIDEKLGTLHEEQK
ncbi:Eco57I restriction-modification methylase domain-containing protein [Aromatoleum bremense]|uniref:site-specific DNA-methyltransferase (adenine-specific) n=1 Tax=Aromatoleum bremense TaxID=76115 RepID=A0ABX1P278_9RHOO|nr:Eco57I restriction-modification methylase domain-containing protein [Aromatoleum bremense]NMG17717.1 SAM-dependent methyltransferase [Aromatoleum bremense]